MQGTPSEKGIYSLNYCHFGKRTIQHHHQKFDDREFRAKLSTHILNLRICLAVSLNNYITPLPPKKKTISLIFWI
ncbi:hypothetical protein DCAR_0935636 [Daucus carota subsp. sativus]|uniref:Uncharacterized protein n=1 Tax=Daucus carota subsp. sativus TaxID=79200 RepID=A0A175YHE4_DAUCS|nr:hypothetical protein DCAR_0935636 [Daucus carota subsp. sativus]